MSKRKLSFGDEEGVIDEKMAKRSDEIEALGLNESNKNNENITPDVNPDIFANYLDLKERHVDLELKYELVQSRVQELEQAKYEEEDYANRVAAERDEAKKKIDQIKAEKEDARNKIETLELLIKDLNDQIDEGLAAIEKFKKENAEMIKEIDALRNDVLKKDDDEAESASHEKELNDMKLEMDNLKKAYKDYIQKHAEFKQSADQRLEEVEKEKNEETERADTAAAKAATLENEVLELQQKLDDTQKELEVQKNAALQQSADAENNVQRLQSQIDELENACKEKDEKLVELQKTFGEMKHNLINEIEQKDAAVVRIAELEAELSEIAKAKDEQIAELRKKLSDAQISYLEKLNEAREKSKVLEHQLVEYRSSTSKAEEKIKALNNKYDLLQSQIETERSLVEKDKEFYVAEYQKIEASLKKIAAENAGIIAEKDGLIAEKERLEKESAEKNGLIAEKERIIADKERVQKESVELEKTLMDKIAELEKSVGDRANKMFEEWKEEMGKQMDKDGKNVSHSVTEVENKCLQESLIQRSETSNDYKLQWIVSKAECEEIYESSKAKIANFLQEYTSRLFSVVEMMLSEAELDQEKWKEAQEVIFWFWKPINKREKELCIAALKKKMKERRQQIRETAFKYCTPNRAVAFTSDDKVFFYELQKSNTWKPFSDEKCQNVMKFRINRFADFGIPTSSEYSTSEYYLIVQESSEDGQQIHKMHPSGSIECTF